MKYIVGLFALVGMFSAYHVVTANSTPDLQTTESHGHSAVALNVNTQLSIADAKALIDTGKDLETIPKNVWKELLSPEQYKIMWEAGTERPYTGELLHEKRAGTFVSAGCNIPLFRSETKYDSRTGWPSFWDVIDQGNVILKNDYSWGMKRIEILSKCGEHLGHVFNDGPSPTGLRYCINSLALKFIPDTEA